MERQAHNSLNEAALEVQLDDSLDESSRERRKEIVNKIHGGPTQKPLETATKAERGDYRDMSSSLGHDSGEFGPDDKLIKHVKDYYAGKHDNVPTQQEIVRANRLERKSKEATSARKKKLTRKKLYPKSGLKGEKKTFADKLFNHVEYDEVDSMVLEYFSNYFGDNLNEDTSDEDIMDAVYDLVELCDAVCGAVGLVEYLHHSQVQEPNYNSIDSMFSHESEFRDFPKSYNAKRMKPLGVSKKDFRKTKKKLKNIHSRMKDNYGSDLESDSLRKQTAREKGWIRH